MGWCDRVDDDDDWGAAPSRLEPKRLDASGTISLRMSRSLASLQTACATTRAAKGKTRAGSWAGRRSGGLRESRGPTTSGGGGGGRRTAIMSERVSVMRRRWKEPLMCDFRRPPTRLLAPSPARGGSASDFRWGEARTSTSGKTCLWANVCGARAQDAQFGASVRARHGHGPSCWRRQRRRRRWLRLRSAARAGA